MKNNNEGIEEETEFNLSEKIIRFGQLTDIEKEHNLQGCHSNKMIYQEEDVKEFIRLLKESCPRCYGARKNIKLGKCDICLECQKIDKLAGEKLT